MKKWTRAALAAWMVTFAFVASAQAATGWYSTSDFASASLLNSGGQINMKGQGTAFWGPRDATANSPIFVVEHGTRVSLIWDADTAGTGSVTLTIQKASGTGSGSSEWEERDVIPAATACTDPATTCSQKLILDPGVYRLVPSGTAAAGRLRADWY